MIDNAQLTTVLDLKDNLSPGLGRAMNSVGTFNRGISQMGRGVGQVGAGLGRLGAIAGTALVGGFTASVKLAADFEAQLNTINTIAQVESPAALQAIGDGIRDLARTTGSSLDDLTTAYYDLLSAGVDVADAQGVLNTATDLAAGTLGTTSQAVDVLTTALNAYNLPASEAAKISEELAIAVRDGKVTLDQIAPTYATVAPLAATMGIETREIAAAFATLTASGTEAGEVTTQMRSALKALLDPTAQLSELQEELGVNFADVAREKGLIFALEEMRRAVGNDDAAFQQLFGRIEGFNFALATTGENFDKAQGQLDEFTGSTNVLADQVSARRQGLAHQLNILKQSLADIGITVGTAVLPVLTPLITDLATFIDQNQDKIKDFAREVGDAFGDLVDRAKAGEFQPFIDALAKVAEVGGKVVDIFLKLPPSIQAAIVTGAALNKLSGGLLLSGAGNIAGGLINIVFQRGSSPANPLWVRNVGLPGGGGGGGPSAPVFGPGAMLLLLTTAIAQLAGGVLMLKDIAEGRQEGAVADFAQGPLSPLIKAIETAVGDPLGELLGLTKVSDEKVTTNAKVLNQQLQAHLSREYSASRQNDIRQGSQLTATLNAHAAERRAEANREIALSGSHLGAQLTANAARTREAVTAASLLASSRDRLINIEKKKTTFTANVSVSAVISASQGQWALEQYQSVKGIIG